MKIIILFLLLIFNNLFASINEKDIEKTIQTKMDNVLIILNDKNNHNLDIYNKIFEEIEPLIDFKLMAKISLGNSQWNMLSNKEKDEYVLYFILKLKNSFIEKLKLYSNEIFRIKDIEKIQIVKNTRIILHSELINKDNSYQIDFKFYNKNDKWIIYDIEIANVSIIQSYRNQFNNFFLDNSFEDLIEWLKN